MAKINTPNVGGPAGGSYPVPSYFGFKWQKLEKHVMEQAYLRDKSRKNATRIQELRNELEFQRARLEGDRAVAERLGKDEPSDEYLQLTQRQIEKHEAKEKSLRRASEMVDRDIQALIVEKAPEYIEHVDERARKEIERYHEIMREAEALRNSVGAMVGLREILTGKEAKMFNVYPPDRMEWNYTPEKADDVIMSDADRDLLASMEG